MEDRSHALIAIGFLVVFGLGAVAIVWWMLTPGAERVPYVLVSKTSVAGLGQGSSVQFNGVSVGVVKNIHIDHATHRSIRVRVAIDKKFPLPEGSYATVGSSSLVGPTIVNIHLGNGRQIIHTSARHPATLTLKQSGVGALMSQAGEIVDDAKQALASVRRMVSKKNVAEVSAILDNIHEASARLVALEQDIAPGAKQLPELLAETRATVNEARSLLAKAGKVVVAARAPLSAVGRAAGSTASLTAQLDQQTVPQLNATLIQLRALAAQMKGLAEELKRSPQSLIVGPPKPQPGPGESGSGSR